MNNPGWMRYDVRAGAAYHEATGRSPVIGVGVRVMCPDCSVELTSLYPTPDANGIQLAPGHVCAGLEPVWEPRRDPY